METIILPGFPPKNQQWAEETRAGLKSLGSVSVVYWEHWQTGQAEPDWIKKGTEKLLASLQGKQVNIIAKSIGTIMAMGILKMNPGAVNKIILCGIPVRDFVEGDEKTYQSLRGFPENNILCVQNNDDNHGSYQEAEKLIHTINPNIKVISKSRSDHEYPYVDEFLVFLA